MHEVVTECNEIEAKTNISKDTNANYFLFVKDCKNSHIYFFGSEHMLHWKQENSEWNLNQMPCNK